MTVFCESEGSAQAASKLLSVLLNRACNSRKTGTSLATASLYVIFELHHHLSQWGIPNTRRRNHADLLSVDAVTEKSRCLGKMHETREHHSGRVHSTQGHSFVNLIFSQFLCVLQQSGISLLILFVHACAGTIQKYGWMDIARVLFSIFLNASQSCWEGMEWWWIECSGLIPVALGFHLVLASKIACIMDLLMWCVRKICYNGLARLSCVQEALIAANLKPDPWMWSSWGRNRSRPTKQTSMNTSQMAWSDCCQT